ncbi:hypothetical protein VCSRO64_3446 [Vibrio cholerae]|nr:hypothetical protein VCSRO64_3446 [Vibrio cholerae]GIA33347.1 hypothetical protein VCSRO85_2847 [Vibrio cholerae]
MMEALQYLTSIGMPPWVIILGGILWKIDKRLTILEAKG